VNESILHDLRRRRFWRHFAVNTFSAVGLVAVLAGLYDVLFPDVVSKASGILTALTVVSALAYGFWRAWPRPIEQQYEGANVKISLVRGDIFTPDSDHLVIGMATTFDTETPHIIARSSLQAQFAQKLYDEDIQALDRDLATALSGVRPVARISKPGKTDVYPVGTVAVLKEHTRCFFCVAYAQLDEQNVARGSVEMVWRSLDELWRAVAIHANGGTIAMPVLGGGLARLAQLLPAQDSIRLIILSFIFASRRERVCDELKIVVLPEQYDRLDRLEIQAFLTSLKLS
jgi:Domain of unknown function (DUF6430)